MRAAFSKIERFGIILKDFCKSLIFHVGVGFPLAKSLGFPYPVRPFTPHTHQRRPGEIHMRRVFKNRPT